MNGSRKIFVAMMVVVILLSSIIVYQNSSLAKAERFPINLQVSPIGSNFKLGVNESRTFVAQVLNNTGTEPFCYSWKVAPTNGSFSLFVNDELKNFADSSVFIIEGNALTLKYPQATSEYVTVQATVIDSQGLTGESNVFVVADPATYPGYKFDGSTADAKYVVRADGTGWFYVTKGLDGSIVSAWSSAVPTTTIEYAVSEGGIVAIADGAYTGASIDMPGDVTLIADPGVTGITYASIADGARIDEPNFNSAFGGYLSGSYTVVTNQSSVATTAIWYLAFKPDNSIYFASTNASTHFKAVINAASTIKGSVYTAPGDYPIQPAIDATFSNVALKSDGAYLYIPDSSPLDLAHQVIFDIDTVENCSIRGFIFDGHQAANRYNSSTPALVRLEGTCSNVDIEYNTFLNSAMYGVLVIAYSGHSITNVNTRFNTFVMGGLWNSIYYLNWDAAGTGISGCDISGNDVSGFADIGICVGEASGGDIRNVKVHHNKVHNGTLNNDYGSSGNNAVFGIRMEGNTINCPIENNDIWGVRIGIGHDGHYSLIQGNTVRNDLNGAVDCIQIFGTYNDIKSNTLYGGFSAWTSGVNFYSTNNTASFNTIKYIGGAGNFRAIGNNGDEEGNGAYYNDCRGCSVAVNWNSAVVYYEVGNMV
jgi:hypothetical protein